MENVGAVDCSGPGAPPMQNSPIAPMPNITQYPQCFQRGVGVVTIRDILRDPFGDGRASRLAVESAVCELSLVVTPVHSPDSSGASHKSPARRLSADQISACRRAINHGGRRLSTRSVGVDFATAALRTLTFALAYPLRRCGGVVLTRPLGVHNVEIVFRDC